MAAVGGAAGMTIGGRYMRTMGRASEVVGSAYSKSAAPGRAATATSTANLKQNATINKPSFTVQETRGVNYDTSEHAVRQMVMAAVRKDRHHAGNVAFTDTHSPAQDSSSAGAKKTSQPQSAQVKSTKADDSSTER